MEPFNKYLASTFLEYISAIIGPLIITTLLLFTLISLLVDKIPTRTIIGAHLTVFLVASIFTHVPILLNFEILVRTGIIVWILKLAGGFLAWIGMKEGSWGLRFWALFAMGVSTVLTLWSALLKFTEPAEERWK
jgi:hypothetical protein